MNTIDYIYGVQFICLRNCGIHVQSIKIYDKRVKNDHKLQQSVCYFPLFRIFDLGKNFIFLKGPDNAEVERWELLS